MHGKKKTADFLLSTECMFHCKGVEEKTCYTKNIKGAEYLVIIVPIYQTHQSLLVLSKINLKAWSGQL